LSVNGLSNRQTATLVDVSNQLQAVISGETPYWSGNQPDWLSTSAWTLQPSNSATTYISGDADIFDDTAIGTYGSTVSLNSGNVAPASVTFNNFGLNYTVSGNYGITGSGALSVQGGGTVTLLNANSYTGATIVNNGTLQLGNGGATGSLSASSAITLGSNGVLAFSRSNNVVQGVDFSAGAITGAGSLVQLGPGALILTANNTYGGTTTISGGTLQLGTGASGQDGAISSTSGVTNNGVLVYNLVGDQSPGYSISGSGSLVKTGTGTLTLGTTSTYSGGTTVNSGKLIDTVSCWYSPRGIGSGMLTINPGATAEFTATHGFGQSASGQPATINGGTLIFDAENYVTNLAMTGGTLTGAGETRPAGGTVTTYPSTLTSVIANGTNLNTGAQIYNVSSGSAGVDLVITGSLHGSSTANGITKTGDGVMVLAGSNTFLGSTTVNNGTLIVATSGGLASGTNLNVGANLSLFSPAPVVAAAAAPTVTAVPEPSAFAILGAALAGAAMVRRVRKLRTAGRNHE
jgi:autotransporter-associated beta strand protein